MDRVTVVMGSSWNQVAGKNFLSWLEYDPEADGYPLPTNEEREFAAAYNRPESWLQLSAFLWHRGRRLTVPAEGHRPSSS